MAQTIIETVRDETNNEIPGTFHMSRYDPSGVSHGDPCERADASRSLA